MKILKFLGISPKPWPVKVGCVFPMMVVCFLKLNSDQMTMGKMHPTLLTCILIWLWNFLSASSTSRFDKSISLHNDFKIFFVFSVPLPRNSPRTCRLIPFRRVVKWIVKNCEFVNCDCKQNRNFSTITIHFPWRRLQ